MVVVLPAMYGPSVDSPCQVVFKVVGTNTREEHWAIKLPWLLPLEIVHLLIEAVACGRVESLKVKLLLLVNKSHYRFFDKSILLTGYVKAGGQNNTRRH